MIEPEEASPKEGEEQQPGLSKQPELIFEFVSVDKDDYEEFLKSNKEVTESNIEQSTHRTWYGEREYEIVKRVQYLQEKEEQKKKLSAV